MPLIPSEALPLILHQAHPHSSFSTIIIKRSHNQPSFFPYINLLFFLSFPSFFQLNFFLLRSGKDRRGLINGRLAGWVAFISHGGFVNFFGYFSSVTISELRGFICFKVKKIDLRRGGLALSRSVFFYAFALFSIIPTRINGGAPTIRRGTR